MELTLLSSIFSDYVRIVDIILAVVIVWGGYKGYRKGFLLELLSIFIFISGVVLIFFLLAKGFTGTESVAGVSIPKSTAFAIYIIVYLVGVVVLNSVGKSLQNKINYSVLDDFDNIAGMIVGAMKHMIFLSIFIWLLSAVGLKLPPEITHDSALYPRLLAFQEWLINVGNVIAPSIGDTAKDIRQLLR